MGGIVSCPGVEPGDTPRSCRGLLCRRGRAKHCGNPASRSLARPARFARGNLLRGSGLPVPSRRTFATGILPCAHSVQARFGILPLARLQGRLDCHGQPLPLTHKSPWARARGLREQRPPRYPCRSASPYPCRLPSRLSRAVSNGSPRRSPPARAGGFFAAHAVPTRIAILQRQHTPMKSPEEPLSGRRPYDGQQEPCSGRMG